MSQKTVTIKITATIISHPTILKKLFYYSPYILNFITESFEPYYLCYFIFEITFILNS